MANQWYYTKDEERQGPVSAEDLKQLVQDGELLPNDLIWKEGMEDWRPASQLKGLFPADAEDPAEAETQPMPGVSSPAAVGVRSAVWQIPQMVVATMFIVAMFLPWWSARLRGNPAEIQKAFSKDVDLGRGRIRSRPDMEKLQKLWRNAGWYVRNLESVSFDFRDLPLDGPARDEEIDIRAKVWGFHSGLGLAAGFFGFALLPLSIMMLGWKAARAFGWVTSFLAAYLCLLLGMLTVLWYFETPGYDVKPVFTQGAHIGPYLVMSGAVLLLIFGIIDGITGLRAFTRRDKS